MNDDESLMLMLIIVVALAVGGGILWGRSVGLHEFKKPCNQFAQWQYQQKVVPVKCIK